MSNTEENKTWQPIESSRSDLTFADWGMMEDRWGEYGDPGYTQFTLPVSFPHHFGHADKVDVNFTLLRNDDGLLVGVHGCYIDNGVQKPFIFMVHPDHQRKGIGTKMADHLRQQYTEARGHDFTYEESFREIVTTEAMAGLINKYVNGVYQQENNG